MILYGSSLSPFVRKVLVALFEKGLAFEHIPVRFHDPDQDFRASSPLGKIPALCDGEVRLADSSAIIHYLDRAHPLKPLLPADARALGRTIWFDKFADTELIGPLLRPFVHRVLRPRVLNLPGDEAVVRKALDEDQPRLFGYLETQIHGPYLVGEAFSLADIAVGTGFVNLRSAGEAVDADRFPKLAAWVAATLERASFKAAIAARKG
ncbi:glutathione S-transferase family protein [Methylobacterium nodulans]|uniref:Glutathione S-transferase domain protein n=1 Tax=Methylobacterium nodulans (strain LMG 21967 / CNCM I-2342 / ORS 2060) TaxID=460265 RepID=B8IML8_METNO|nr:glutathione S-transferase family protein [Methylobacterium nodulans]ACL60211.1 Glutathione S-transferase domain protein [Methylobacterium nodulans ORS 2060]